MKKLNVTNLQSLYLIFIELLALTMKMMCVWIKLNVLIELKEFKITSWFNFEEEELLR